VRPLRKLSSKRVRGARILLRIGTFFLAAGILMVAFVAYQLWGTALYEHGAQATLRNELRALVGRQVVPHGPATSSAPSNPSTTGPTSTAAKAHGAATTTLPQATTTTSPQATTTTVPVIPEQAAPSVLNPVHSHPATAAYLGYVAPAGADPAVGAPIGYLSIPKIGVDDAIVEGVGEAQLQGGPGHYPGTPLPGEAGNAAIAGHRTTYAAPFYNLNELQPGDPIYVQTSQGTFTYSVTQSFAVLPTNVSVLDPTSQPTLTLTTCNPRYSAAQRLIVKADLVQSQPPPGGAPAPAAAAPAEKPLPRQLAGETALAGTGEGPTLAVLWGVVTALLGVGVVVARRQRSWPRLIRIGVLALGTPLGLGALFLFFSHVSTALPGSF
jgi:sortase A